MSTERGIVISPPFKLTSNGGLRMIGSPSAHDLRKYLLYWDRIDYPNNNIISIAASDDINYLINAGVARRSEVHFKGVFKIGAPGENVPFIMAQELVFERLNSEAPGQWSMAQLANDLYFTDAIERAGIEFELWNALPVPKDDVPLPDILEFKERRQDELLSLRGYLDELYQQIIGAADISRERISQLAKLEQALINVEKTLCEFGIRRIYSSLRSCFACAGLALGGIAAGAGVVSLFELPLSLGAGGSIGAAIMIARGKIKQPKSEQTQPPLSYLNSIGKELGR